MGSTEPEAFDSLMAAVEAQAGQILNRNIADILHLPHNYFSEGPALAETDTGDGDTGMLERSVNKSVRRVQEQVDSQQ